MYVSSYLFWNVVLQHELFVSTLAPPFSPLALDKMTDLPENENLRTNGSNDLFSM